MRGARIGVGGRVGTGVYGLRAGRGWGLVGFVWENGLRGRGDGGGGGGGGVRLGAGCQERFEFAEGAGVLKAKVAGIALEQVERVAGAVDQRLKGDGGAEEFIGGFELLLHGGLGAQHFGIDPGGFDVPEAAETPAGGGHFFDEEGFRRGGGLETVEEGLGEFAEVLFIFIGEEHGAVGGEAVAEGVVAGAGFAFGSDRSTGFGAVAAGGFDLA